MKKKLVKSTGIWERVLSALYAKGRCLLTTSSTFKWGVIERTEITGEWASSLKMEKVHLWVGIGDTEMIKQEGFFLSGLNSQSFKLFNSAPT